jgi:hypothetical protein
MYKNKTINQIIFLFKITGISKISRVFGQNNYIVGGKRRDRTAATGFSVRRSTI